MNIFDPVMANAEAAKFEAEYFARNEASEEQIIERVGEGIARRFLEEFGGLVAPRNPSIFAAVGSGHNAADTLAFLACIAQSRGAQISLLMPPRQKLRPNTAQMLARLESVCRARIFNTPSEVETKPFDILAEGLAGMGYRPPMRPEMAERINLLNRLEASVKISVDVPAGLSDAPESGAPIFAPDATYATAIAKKCLFEISSRASVGRIRYIDAGFFEGAQGESERLIVKESALGALKKLRPANSDKRAYGRLLIVSGSRTYAGAALINAKTAIRAGAGFVYACAPEGFKPAFCAAEPSVIWLDADADETGAIALENFQKINAIARNADAILAGSGLTASRESAVLAAELLKANPDVPAVIDADAICPQVLQTLPARRAASIITPHEGEFLRCAKDASDASLEEFARRSKCVVALKSSITRISDGARIAYSAAGSPILSRAGSGDALCAIMASMLADKHLQKNLSEAGGTPVSAAFKTAALACHWLGKTAEMAASEAPEISFASSEIPALLRKALQK